jgi:two-component system, chemotaxis family, response regulator Rcp1
MKKVIDILLVEDSSSDRYLAVEALAEAEILNEVHTVGDGVEALNFLRRAGKYAQARRPDLILLDLYLPRKDGRQVLAELKADPDLRNIPVVILAGDSVEGARAYPEHAQTFISKPLDLKQFDQLIRMFKDLWFPEKGVDSDFQSDRTGTRFFALEQFEHRPTTLKEEEKFQRTSVSRPR